MIIPSKLKEGDVIKRINKKTCFRVYNGENGLLIGNGCNVNDLNIEEWDLLGSNEFTKDDKEKISLIDMNLTEIFKALEFGAKKYPANNWQKCQDTKRYKDALLRHVFAYLGGEKIDADSGLHHLAHAATNCLFLVFFDKKEGGQ
jgi:hypothetical protein